MTAAYTPVSIVQKCHLSLTVTNTSVLRALTFDMAFLVGVGFLYLFSREGEDLFIDLLVIQVSSFVNCLFKSFVHFFPTF